MAIDRYVFVKLAAEAATPASREEIAAYTREALGALPGVQAVRVGVPADAAATASWDLSIVVTFARIEDVEPYRVHPLHRAYVDEYLAPRTVVIKAWNFDTAA
ncbi:MAG TPA: Dabb family protein [Kofleriaceae bacterium]|nr:Dabb family protein [Kofleriaceae bacterium]